jgi:uncharacterized membrane protein
MTTAAHLWAIGYDDMERADEVREEITRLAWDGGQAGKYLILLDVVVVVRHPDGTFTFDRKPFPAVANILGCTAAGFIAGLVLGAPLTGATVGALLGSAGSATLSSVGIEEDFVREVKGLMQPGSSTLFLLDEEADMEMILHAIRGLGGKVLKANVDLDRAKLIQSTLAAAARDCSTKGGSPDNSNAFQGGFRIWEDATDGAPLA